MHAVLISSHILGQYMESDENDVLVKMLRVIEIFTYLGSILY